MQRYTIDPRFPRIPTTDADYPYSRPGLYNRDLWDRECSGNVPTIPPDYPPSRPTPPMPPTVQTIPVFTRADQSPFSIGDVSAMDRQDISEKTFAMFIPKGYRYLAFAIPADKSARVIIRESGMSNVTATIQASGIIVDVSTDRGEIPYMIYSDNLPGFGYEGDIHYDITMS